MDPMKGITPPVLGDPARGKPVPPVDQRALVVQHNRMDKPVRLDWEAGGGTRTVHLTRFRSRPQPHVRLGNRGRSRPVQLPE